MPELRARRNWNCGRRPVQVRRGRRRSRPPAGGGIAGVSSKFGSTWLRLHDQRKESPQPKIDLDAEAMIALEQARGMRPGVERTEAMKRAGILRNAADLQGLF